MEAALQPAGQSAFAGPPQVVGWGHNHGSAPHIAEINRQVTDMVSTGGLDKIFIDRQLKTAGLAGKLRPDIIGKKFGVGFDIREIASISQRGGAG